MGVSSDIYTRKGRLQEVSSCFFVGPCAMKVNGMAFPSVFESFYLTRLCDLWAPSVLFRTVCPPDFQPWNSNPLQYFAWWIPWTEEPGRLQSMGSQRVRHTKWLTHTHTHTHTHASLLGQQKVEEVKVKEEMALFPLHPLNTLNNGFSYKVLTYNHWLMWISKCIWSLRGPCGIFLPAILII